MGLSLRCFGSRQKRPGKKYYTRTRNKLERIKFPQEAVAASSLLSVGVACLVRSPRPRFPWWLYGGHGAAWHSHNVADIATSTLDPRSCKQTISESCFHRNVPFCLYLRSRIQPKRLLRFKRNDTIPRLQAFSEVYRWHPFRYFHTFVDAARRGAERRRRGGGVCSGRSSADPKSKTIQNAFPSRESLKIFVSYRRGR